MAKELVHKFEMDARVRITGGPLSGEVGTVVHQYKFSQLVTPEYVVRLDRGGADFDDDWNVLEDKLELADEIGVDNE